MKLAIFDLGQTLIVNKDASYEATVRAQAAKVLPHILPALGKQPGLQKREVTAEELARYEESLVQAILDYKQKKYTVH